MPEPLLAVLKLCALALLYLFFFRVLRAVWAEVHAPRMAAAGSGALVGGRTPSRRHAVDRLVVVEPAQRRGRTYELGEEVTLGRSSACQVVLDDGYASQVHARVHQRDGAFYLEDLGSTNGTLLNNRKVTAPVALKKGDRVRIGSTLLEVGA